MADAKRPILATRLIGGGIGLSNETRATILREEGTANVASIKLATQADIDHVRAMGGYIPNGRIVQEIGRAHV